MQFQAISLLNCMLVLLPANEIYFHHHNYYYYHYASLIRIMFGDENFPIILQRFLVLLLKSSSVLIHSLTALLHFKTFSLSEYGKEKIEEFLIKIHSNFCVQRQQSGLGVNAIHQSKLRNIIVHTYHITSSAVSKHTLKTILYLENKLRSKNNIHLKGKCCDLSK